MNVNRWIAAVACAVVLAGTTSLHALQTAAPIAPIASTVVVKSVNDKATLDLVETAAKVDSCKTLCAAIKAVGLVETPKGKGPYTVLAPTDKAFAKLPKETLAELLKPKNKDQLAAILKYHVISGNLSAADIIKLKTAKTVNGEKVSISTKDKTELINTAKVTKVDVKCTNGMIHIIDSVLMPQE